MSNKIPKLILALILAYLAIGLLLNFFIAFQTADCPPCAKNAKLCPICSGYSLEPYLFRDIGSKEFWVSLMLWPLALYLYVQEIIPDLIDRILLRGKFF